MRGSSVARSRTVGGAFAVGVALTMLGAAAWACVPQGRITLNPASGPIGTQVTVSGTNFTADSSIKVWWGGVGRELMATGTVGSDRTFKATFKVPQSSGGNQVVSASQYDAEGKALGSPANATFNVEGAARASNAPNQQGQPSEADGSAALESSESPQPAPAPAPAAASAPANAGSTRTARSPQAAPATQTARATQPSRTATAAAPAAAAPAPAVAAEPAPAPAPAPAAAAPAKPEAPETAFAAPAEATDETETSRRRTPVWALAALALLSLGFFSAGTAIFLNERKRVRAEA